MSVPIIKSSPEERIHENIIKLATSRDIVLDNYKKLNSTEFRNQDISLGLFDYFGVDKVTKLKYYIIFPTISGRYIKKAFLNKLINQNPADRYIVILQDKKSVKIDDLTKNVEFIVGTESMIADVTEGDRLRGIQYRILSKDEVEQFASVWKIPSLLSLPKIPKSSASMVYSRAEVGDVIEMTYPSYATSGRSGDIRLVIP